MKSELMSSKTKYESCFSFEDGHCATSPPSSNEATDEDESMSNGESSAKENEVWSPNPKKSEDYHRRRQRNNLAVKKSRDKAKQRQKEFARHLEVLTVENKRLHMKAEVLMKELNLLRGLFPVVGLSPPPEADSILMGD